METSEPTFSANEEEGEKPASQSRRPPAPEVSASRRGFLKALGAGVLIAGAGLGGVAINDGERILGETLNRKKEEAALAKARERLRNEFGVEVDFSPLQPLEKEEEWLSGESVEHLVEKRRVCEALIDAFAIYPPVIYKKESYISIVRVMDDLKLITDGTPENIHGLAEAEGVLHLRHIEKDGVLPISRRGFFGQVGRKNLDKAGFIGTFHHELFHDLDDIGNEEWVANTRGVSPQMSTGALVYMYREELDKLANNNTITKSEKDAALKELQGFAYDDGKENPEEDRATIAELLLSAPEELGAPERMDQVLSKKISFIKKFCFQKSRGIMDEGYWETIRHAKGNSEIVARYHKERAEALARLSLDELRAYVEKETGERLDDEKLKSWREDILLGVSDAAK